MRQALIAGTAYFALLFGLGFLLGTMRQLLMGLGLDRGQLVLAEIPVMLVFAWWAAGWSASRFAVPASTKARMVMGTAMFALLRLGEAAVGFALMDLSLDRQLAALWTWGGALEMVPQAATALFPLLRARFT